MLDLDRVHRGFGKNWRTYCFVVLWLLMVVLPLVCMVAGGIELIKSSITGLLLQFIGTMYWADRVRDRASWIGGFWVRGSSEEWEKILFGAIGFMSLALGILISVAELFEAARLGQ